MPPRRRAGDWRRTGWPDSWLWLCAGPGRGVKRHRPRQSRCCARSMVGVQLARVALAIGDLGSQRLGLLDPAHDELLGRQEANELALPVGLAHRFGEIGGIAIFELL